jgi:integrase
MYSIRHISATEMLAGGADLAAVAAQLGHRDLTTTGRYYAHALPQAQRAAAKALPDCTKFGAVGADAKKKA